MKARLFDPNEKPVIFAKDMQPGEVAVTVFDQREQFILICTKNDAGAHLINAIGGKTFWPKYSEQSTPIRLLKAGDKIVLGE